MPTPEASEWEEPTAVLVARGVLGRAQDVARTTFTIENAQAVHDAWDAYDAAVRAALVADIVAGVEKMRGYGFDEHEELIAWEGGWYVMRSDVTDYLHGLAPETDPNG